MNLIAAKCVTPSEPDASPKPTKELGGMYEARRNRGESPERSNRQRLGVDALPLARPQQHDRKTSRKGWKGRPKQAKRVTLPTNRLQSGEQQARPALGKKRPSKQLTRRSKSRQKASATRSVRIQTDWIQRTLSADLHTEGEEPLTGDLSLSRVEALLLRRSFLKKYEGATTELANLRSIAEFLERNAASERWTYQSSALFDDEIDGEFRSILADAILPSYDSSFGLAEIAAGFMPGPGASIGCEEEDFLTKVFHSGLSCTDVSLHVFYTYAIRGSTWGEAEKKRHSQYGLKVVVGNRLSTVPKTVDETRVICTEPLLNMLFQKGIGQFLERVLRDSFGIDIRRGSARTQPEINRELARLGSMTEGRNSFCTIDLKGASDSVSVRLCEHSLPRQLMTWLRLTRSPVTILPNGDQVKLSMISSMGNAFTFPLQTLIFASIVKACYRVLGIRTPRCDSREPTYGVFGDDIVCVKDAYEVVRRALVRYGFTVNDQKSFSSGPFRESCGGDYWRGNLVRGVYVRMLNTEPDVYSAINRLVRWSVRSGVCCELTLWYLLSRIRKKLITVPFQEGDTSGLKVPYTLHEAKAYALGTRSPIFRALQPRVRSYAVPNEAVPWSIKGGHRRNYNGDGLLVALCGGFIRDGRIGLREKSDNPTYTVRWRLVPYWDHVSKAEASLLRDADWKLRAAEILQKMLS